MSEFDKIIDELLSDDSLKEQIGDTIDEMPEAEFKQLVADAIKGDTLKACMEDYVDSLIDEKRAEGNVTEDQLTEEKKNLLAFYTSDGVLEAMRETFLNNPEVMKMLKDGFKNLPPEQLNEVRGQLKQKLEESTAFVMSRHLYKGIENGHLDAAFWGLEAAGNGWVLSRAASTALEKSGTQAAKSMSLLKAGSKVPYIGAALTVAIDGYFIWDQIERGDYKGAAVTGGGLGGAVVGTLATAAATAGALATAPVWVTGAAATAVCLGTYYTGRNIVKIGQLIGETRAIYADIRRQQETQVARFPTILGGAIPSICYDRSSFKILERAGVPLYEGRMVKHDDLIKALTDPDPKKSSRVREAIRSAMKHRRDEYIEVRDEHDSFWPDWIRSDDGISKHVMAEGDTIMMKDALKELDGWCNNHVNHANKIRTMIEEQLKPYKALDLGEQRVIDMISEKNYAEYKEKFGEDALDKEDYLLQNRISLSTNAEVLVEVRKAEQVVKDLTDQYLKKWDKENPVSDSKFSVKVPFSKKTWDGNNHGVKRLAAAAAFADELRKESLYEPEKFAERANEYSQQEAARVAEMLRDYNAFDTGTQHVIDMEAEKRYEAHAERAEEMGHPQMDKDEFLLTVKKALSQDRGFLQKVSESERAIKQLTEEHMAVWDLENKESDADFTVQNPLHNLFGGTESWSGNAHGTMRSFKELQFVEELRQEALNEPEEFAERVATAKAARENQRRIAEAEKRKAEERIAAEQKAEAERVAAEKKAEEEGLVSTQKAPAQEIPAAPSLDTVIPVVAGAGALVSHSSDEDQGPSESQKPRETAGDYAVGENGVQYTEAEIDAHIRGLDEKSLNAVFDDVSSNEKSGMGFMGKVVNFAANTLGLQSMFGLASRQKDILDDDALSAQAKFDALVQAGAEGDLLRDAEKPDLYALNYQPDDRPTTPSTHQSLAA